MAIESLCQRGKFIMSKLTETRFKDLKEGYEIKYPSRGKDAKTGTIIDIQRDKTDTSILVRWDNDEGVSSALRPHDSTILAKEK